MASTEHPGHGSGNNREDDPAGKNERGYYARSGAYPPDMRPLQESRAFDRGPAPRTVATACSLVVASGVVNALLAVTTPDVAAALDRSSYWSVMLGATSAVALALVLARFLRKGNRVARVVLLIAAGLNLVGSVLALAVLAGGGPGPGQWVLHGLSPVLVLLAAALTLTPSGRAFFARSGFSA